MNTKASSSTDRIRIAREAVGALGSHRADHQRLAVRCSRSHHVAAVYRTDAGLVVVTSTGPHAHGSRDFLDAPHHSARHGREHADLLEAIAPDEIPARCECGPRTLSRKAMLQFITRAQRVMRVK